MAIPYRLMVRDEVPKVSQLPECARDVGAVALRSRTVWESFHRRGPEVRARRTSVFVGSIAQANPESQSELSNQVARRMPFLAGAKATCSLDDVILFLSLE